MSNSPGSQPELFSGSPARAGVLRNGGYVAGSSGDGSTGYEGSNLSSPASNKYRQLLAPEDEISRGGSGWVRDGISGSATRRERGSVGTARPVENSRSTTKLLTAPPRLESTLGYRQRGAVGTNAHLVPSGGAHLSLVEDECDRGAAERREIEVQREMLRWRGEAEQLRRELTAQGAKHREEMIEALNDLRRRQREDESEVCNDLRDVKAERNRLEQETDLLRMELADVRREAEQFKLDLEQQRDKELAEFATRLEATERADGETAGVRAEIERGKGQVREMKMELASLRGKLAVLERQGTRVQNEEIAALSSEVTDVRAERDAAREELRELQEQLASVDRLRGTRVMELEAEVRSLRLQCEESERNAGIPGDSERTVQLEAKVCVLQDMVRRLKDARETYMTQLDIREFDRVEEAELEVAKARGERREALLLADAMQQELKRARMASAERGGTTGGRNFDDELKKLAEKATRPAKKHFGVP
eukprot:Hpha_TRINITY_DN943_c0_g1::TRINITY_DN943_c0_g1_i1::g.156226::m.156226